MTPQPRTLVVLASLVFGMTLTSGLLLLLEPGPVAPFTGVALQSVDQSRAYDPRQTLFETETPLQWKAIVIHDSGAPSGSARSINAAHEQAGRGGLGYHFVVNNGSEARDGQIELGFRWQRQFVGAYLQGDGADWFHRHAIGVCVVGDAQRSAFTDAQLRELIWLIRQLQTRFNIPRDAVYVSLGDGQPQSVRHFPYAWFRQQLATPTAP